MSTVNWSLAIVSDSALTLLETNPVLLNYQVGVESDTKLFKIGDGATAWNDLAYAVLNGQQSVWMGPSVDADNLLGRSDNDGGLILKTSLFMSAQEHIDALNSNSELNAMDASAPLKAALYRITVLMRSVIQAMGSDFANLKTAAYVGTSVQARIAAVMDQVTVVQGLIDDNTTGGAKTWSSTRITSAISTAVSTAVASLVGNAPEALNTLYELAAALGENTNLVTTISQDLGSTIRFNTAQSLTTEQRLQARSNMGAASSSLLGDYTEIGNKTLMQHLNEARGLPAPPQPTIPEILQRLEALELRTTSARASMSKSSYDSITGQYRTVTWRRADLTTSMRSSMSTANSDGLYTKRQETYYAADGTTAIQTVVYDLTYDSNRNVVTETISSIF